MGLQNYRSAWYSAKYPPFFRFGQIFVKPLLNSWVMVTRIAFSPGQTPRASAQMWALPSTRSGEGCDTSSPTGRSFRNGDPVAPWCCAMSLTGELACRLGMGRWFTTWPHDIHWEGSNDGIMGSSELTYVDDILFFAKDLEICRAMLKKLQESMEIKRNGQYQCSWTWWRRIFILRTEIHWLSWRKCYPFF